METGTGVLITVENALKAITNGKNDITYKVNKTDITVKKSNDKNDCCDIYGRVDGIRIYVKRNSVEYNVLKNYNFLSPVKEGTQDKYLDYYFQFKSLYVKPVLNELFK